MFNPVQSDSDTSAGSVNRHLFETGEFEEPQPVREFLISPGEVVTTTSSTTGSTTSMFTMTAWNMRPPLLSTIGASTLGRFGGHTATLGLGRPRVSSQEPSRYPAPPVQ